MASKKRIYILLVLGLIFFGSSQVAESQGRGARSSSSSSQQQVGVMESLSLLSHRAFNNSCPFHQERQEWTDGECSTRSASSPVAESLNHSRGYSQEMFLAALAERRAQTDQCAVDFLKANSQGENFDDYAGFVLDRIQLLAPLTASAQQIQKQLGDLDRAEAEGMGRAPQSARRAEWTQELRRLQAAISAIESSIPLAEQKDMSQFILRAVARSNSNSGATEASLKTDLQQAMRRAQSSVEEDIKVLQRGATNPARHLSRQMRESLVQDQDLVESFLGQNPDLRKDLEPLACQAFALYGQGAQQRDMALLVGAVGTTVLSFGTGILLHSGARGVAMGASAISGQSRLAAARGIVSLRTSRILNATAIGLDTGVGLDAVDRSCLQHQRVNLVTLEPNQNQAQNCHGFSIEALNQESCVLAASLTALGVAGATPLVHRAVTRGLLSTEHQGRLQRAETVLGRRLSAQERQAVIQAHYVGFGQRGRDGQNLAGLNNYTPEQLRQKARILEEAGFSPAERRSLMEAGITGLPSGGVMTRGTAQAERSKEQSAAAAQNYMKEAERLSRSAFSSSKDVSAELIGAANYYRVAGESFLAAENPRRAKEAFSAASVQWSVIRRPLSESESRDALRTAIRAFDEEEVLRLVGTTPDQAHDFVRVYHRELQELASDPDISRSLSGIYQKKAISSAILNVDGNLLSDVSNPRDIQEMLRYAEEIWRKTPDVLPGL